MHFQLSSNQTSPCLCLYLVDSQSATSQHHMSHDLAQSKNSGNLQSQTGNNKTNTIMHFIPCTIIRCTLLSKQIIPCNAYRYFITMYLGKKCNNQYKALWSDFDPVKPLQTCGHQLNLGVLIKCDLRKIFS